MGNSSSNNNSIRLYASLLGSSGVAAGAFGAHALKTVLEKRGSTSYWQTAVLYQLVHATALLALSASTSSSGSLDEKDKPIDDNDKNQLLAAKLMTVGTLMFSGSLYGLALGFGPKYILGPTTPIGGTFMIAGWVVLGYGSLFSDSK